MKRITLIIVYLLFGLIAFGQDVGVSGSYVPTLVTVGNTADLNVTFNQNDFIEYPVGEVWIQITIPDAHYSVIGDPTGTLLDYFGDLAETSPGLWFSYNTQVIPALLDGGFLGAQATFVVQGDVPIPENNATLFDVGFDNSTDQVTGDNNATAGLIVEASLPMSLISFDGSFVRCGEIGLTWAVTSEYNNDYMEVQRSSDGRHFEAVGMVESRRSISGKNVYYFTDLEVDAVSTNDYYYYRLRQVDMDGSSTLHKIITVRYHCKPDAPEMTVFPNPASDVVRISLSNIIHDRDVNAVIRDATGKVVKKIVINSARGAEIELSDLATGVFRVETIDLEQDVSQRFIRLK